MSHTPGPWKFAPQEGYAELAKLQNRKLAEHEGYFRENSGDWIIGFTHEGGGRLGTASFRGKAKRGEAWQAPDAEGMANARLIAAAPELLNELEEVLGWAIEEKAALREREIESIRAVIAKAKGEPQ